MIIFENIACMQQKVYVPLATCGSTLSTLGAHMPPLALVAAGGVGGTAALAAFLRSALQVDADLRREMSADDWNFVLSQRWSDVMVGFAFAVHNAGWIAGCEQQKHWI